MSDRLQLENDRMRIALDKIYNHNEAARAAVIEHYGQCHATGDFIPRKGMNTEPVEKVYDPEKITAEELQRQNPSPKWRAVQTQPKHSAIASILWQFMGELEKSSKEFTCGAPIDEDLILASRLAIGQTAADLKKVLGRTYGKRDATTTPMEDDLRAKYHELIYAVARKFPNETRHETALRYIRQAENKSSLAEECKAAQDTVNAAMGSYKHE